VYDNFGEDGLRAGLDCMGSEADMNQLRQQWTDFRSNTYLQEIHMQAAPKSSLEVRVSAAKAFKQLMNGFIPSVWPVIYEASVATEVAVSCTDNLDFHIGSVFTQHSPPVCYHVLGLCISACLCSTSSQVAFNITNEVTTRNHSL
jgi:hypothetical protein